MAFAPMGLRAVLDMGEFNKGQREYNADIKDLEKRTKGVGKRLTSALRGVASVAGGMLAVQGIQSVVSGVKDLVNTATDVDNLANTFDKLTASAGIDATDAMVKLRAQTKGLVTDQDLYTGANRLFAMGLATSADEAARLSEMAVTLGSAFGEEAGPSMENFALTLANQSIPRLDSFGISGAKVRGRIEELQKATPGLSRETAFMTAVMEQGTVAMGKLGDITTTNAAKMTQIKTQIANVKVAFGRALLPAVNAVLTPLANLAEKMGPKLIAWAGGLEKTIRTLSKGFGLMGKIANRIFDWIGTGFARLIDWAGAVTGVAKRLGDWLDPIREKLRPIGNAIQFVRDNWDDLNDVIENFLTYVSTETDVLKPLYDTLVKIGLAAGPASRIAGLGGSIQDFIAAVKEGQKPLDALSQTLKYSPYIYKGAGKALYGLVQGFQNLSGATEIDWWDNLFLAFGMGEDMSLKLSEAISGIATSIAGGNLSGAASKLMAPLGLALPDAWKNILDQKIPYLVETLTSLPQTMVEAWQTGGIGEVFKQAFASAFDIAGSIAGIRVGLVDGIFQLGQDVLTTLGQAFPGIQPVIEGVFRPLLNVVTEIWNAFNEAKTVVIDAILGMFANPQETVGGFKETLANLLPTIQSLITTVGDIAQRVLPLFIQVFQFAVNELIPTAMEVIGQLVPIVTSLAGTFMDVAERVLPILISVLGTITDTAVPLFMSILEAAVPVVQDIIDIVLEVAEDVLPVAQEVFERIANVIEDLMPTIQATIQDALSIIQTVWEKVWPILETTVTEALDVIVPLIEGIVETVSKVVEAVKLALEGDWVGAWEAMKEAVSTILETVKTVITEAIEGVIQIIRSILGLEGGTGTLAEIATDTWQGFIDATFDMAQGVQDMVGAVVTGAINLVLEKVTEWTEAGKDLIGGLITGITDKIQDVKDAAVGVVTDAVDAVKSFLGIASDSKTMEKIAGQTIGGFVNPIKAASGEFISAGASVSESLGIGVGSGVPAIKGAMGDVLGIFDAMVSWVIRFATEVSSSVSGLYDVGELFEDMAEGIKDLSTAFLGMAEAVSAFTTGRITTEDVYKYLDQYAAFAEFAHTKMLYLYNTLGDKDIKRAENAGERLGNMLDAVFRDLSEVKPGNWDDLAVVLDQVVWLGETMARKINAFVTGTGGIGATTLKYVAEWSGYIRTILGLVSTNLRNVEPSDAVDFEQRVTKFVDQLYIMAELMKEKFKGTIGALLVDYQRAAQIVGYVKELVGFMVGSVEALEKVSKYKTSKGLLKAIQNWSLDMYNLVDEIVTLAGRFGIDAVEAASILFDAAEQVVGFVKPGVDALENVADYQTSRGLVKSIQNFGLDMFDLVDELVTLSGKFAVDGIDAAKKLFSSTKDVIGFIKPGVDALEALATYKRVQGIGQKAQDLRNQLFKVIDALRILATNFKGKGLPWAAEWAGYVTQIVGVIKPGIDALAALAEFERIVNVAAQIASFRGQLQKVLEAFKNLAYNYRGQGVVWAAEWAGYATSMVGLIKPGIDALKELGQFERVRNVAGLIESFRNQISKVLEQIRQLASHFAGKGLEWAAEFAGHATAMVGLIKPGVDALASLATFKRVEGIAALIQGFRGQLAKVIEELRLLASNFRDKGLPWAAEWAGYVTSMVGVIKPGIEAIAALADYIPTASLAQIMTSFRTQLSLVIEQIRLMAEDFRETGIGWAAKFAGDALTMIGLIKPGIDALKNIVEYAPAGTLAAKAKALRIDIGKVLRQIIKLAKNWRGKGVRMATKFAKAVEKLLKFLKPSIEGIIQLVLYKQVDKLPRNVKDWKRDITTFLEAVRDLAKTFRRHMNAMERFFVDMQELLEGFQNMNDTMAGIADVIIGWGPSMADAANVMRDIVGYARQIAEYADETYLWLGGVFDPDMGEIPGNVQNWATAFAEALAAIRQAFINENIVSGVFDPIAEAMQTINAHFAEFAGYVGVFSDMADDMGALGTGTQGVLYDTGQGFQAVLSPVNLIVSKLINEGLLPNWAQYFRDAAAALSPTLAQAFWDAYHALIGYAPPGEAAAYAAADVPARTTSSAWVPAYAAPSPMAASAVGPASVNINFGNVTISNDMDLASFSAFLREQVRDELRR